MASGLGIDKVLINFVEYNTGSAKGQRIKNSIGFYISTFAAKRLSMDIMSGRIAKLGKLSRSKAQKENKKYSDDVYMQQGGTPSAYAKDGIPVARQFTITPGAQQPWILCARQGPGHETKEGLIVMDKCEQTIRVPLTSEKLKELAIALDTAYDIWAQLRFVPVVAPMMNAANQKRKDAVDARKAASAASTQSNLRS